MLAYAPQSRRSTVSTTRHTTPSTWDGHAQYLQRDGAQLEHGQGHGLGWGAESERDIREALREWRVAGDGEMYKIVVSPEEGKRLDLKDHVRELMRRAEQDTGQRLDWVAIEHRNTSHHHVHLLVRGVTRDGQKTQLPQRYLHSEFQAHSRELATDALGWRSEREDQRGLMRLSHTLNKTSLDTELNRVMSKRTRIANLERTPPEQRGALEARLRYLASYGLARQTERGWQMSPGFTQTLRTVGLVHNKQRSRAKGRITPSAPDLPVSMRLMERGEAVVGVLIDAGRQRDKAKTPWALLETTSGELRYLAGPELSAVAAARLARTMRSGTTIALHEGAAQILSPGRGEDASLAAAHHLRHNGLPIPDHESPGFAGRVQQHYRENPLQTKETMMQIEIDDGVDRARLHRVLAHVPDGVAVQGVDGRTRTLSLDKDGPELLPGDVVAQGSDGKLRPFTMGPQGQLSKEAVDAQIFADIRSTGGVVGRQPHGEELRINARNELAAHYESQSAQRTLELIAAGVLRTQTGPQAGRLELTPGWRAAYVAERREAAKSDLPAVADMPNRVRGVVREVGAINARGQRGIVLDTPEGNAFLPSSITRAHPGQVVEASRTDPTQAWALKTSLSNTDRKTVLDGVRDLRKAVEKERLAKQGRGKSRSRSRSDLER